jgi:hypothetical protein
MLQGIGGGIVLKYATGIVRHKTPQFVLSIYI